MTADVSLRQPAIVGQSFRPLTIIVSGFWPETKAMSCSMAASNQESRLLIKYPQACIFKAWQSRLAIDSIVGRRAIICRAAAPTLPQSAAATIATNNETCRRDKVEIIRS